jgi:hypothetical protein
MRILLHPTHVRLARRPQRQVVDACDVGASHDDKAPMRSALDHGLPIMNVQATADPPWKCAALSHAEGSITVHPEPRTPDATLASVRRFWPSRRTP